MINRWRHGKDEREGSVKTKWVFGSCSILCRYKKTDAVGLSSWPVEESYGIALIGIGMAAVETRRHGEYGDNRLAVHERDTTVDDELFGSEVPG